MRFVTAFAAATLLMGAGPGLADSKAPESAETHCAALADRAMKLVDAGEIAETKQARIEAYREAISVAERALEIDDKNPDAHFAIFASEGRITLLEDPVPNPITLYKAQGKLDYVLELDPDHPNALAAKGGLYRQLPWALGGDLDKAEDYLKRAIDANPNAIGARLELAETYRAKGQTDKCPELLDKALENAIEQNKQHRIEETRRLMAELDR